MRFSGFHTHTVFSDGKQTPRENVEAALALGFSALGFSDHSYTAFDTSYCIPKEKYAEYIQTVRALQKEYEGRIEIALGIEYDGFTVMPERKELDYVLGDCHYVKTSGGYFSVDHCIEGHRYLCETFFGGDYTAFARAYFEGYTAAMTELKPDILGHFDLVSKFCLTDENDPRYLSYAREALRACLSTVPFIELNTGAIARGMRKVPYPAPYLLDDVKECGGIPILGSDSHEVKNLDFYFKEAIELLKAHGFQTIGSFRAGKLIEIPLE